MVNMSLFPLKSGNIQLNVAGILKTLLQNCDFEYDRNRKLLKKKVCYGE